jgi:hypothetical protein
MTRFVAMDRYISGSLGAQQFTLTRGQPAPHLAFLKIPELPWKGTLQGSQATEMPRQYTPMQTPIL